MNGLQYNHRAKKLDFTNTSYLRFGNVSVDPNTLEPATEPQIVTESRMQGDDFLVDVDANVAYVTTHRENTIVKVDLATGVNTTIAGDPFHTDMIGLTSGAWDRGMEWEGNRHIL